MEGEGDVELTAVRPESIVSRYPICGARDRSVSRSMRQVGTRARDWTNDIKPLLSVLLSNKKKR